MGRPAMNIGTSPIKERRKEAEKLKSGGKKIQSSRLFRATDRKFEASLDYGRPCLKQLNKPS